MMTLVASALAFGVCIEDARMCRNVSVGTARDARFHC